MSAPVRHFATRTEARTIAATMVGWKVRVVRVQWAERPTWVVEANEIRYLRTDGFVE